MEEGGTDRDLNRAPGRETLSEYVEVCAARIDYHAGMVQPYAPPYKSETWCSPRAEQPPPAPPRAEQPPPPTWALWILPACT